MCVRVGGGGGVVNFFSVRFFSATSVDVGIIYLFVPFPLQGPF